VHHVAPGELEGDRGVKGSWRKYWAEQPKVGTVYKAEATGHWFMVVWVRGEEWEAAPLASIR
jgi:hypothetical protein